MSTCWLLFAMYSVCLCIVIIYFAREIHRQLNLLHEAQGEPLLEIPGDPQSPVLPIDSSGLLGRYVSVYDSRSTEEICAICCEALVTSEEVVQLPSCQHVLHYICLREWLAVKNECPLCKRPTNLI